MSNQERPRETPGEPEATPARKGFRIGGIIFGRRTNRGPAEEAAEPPLEGPDPDEMPDEVLETPVPEPDTGSLDFGVRSLITIQRPIVYSGTRSGFFENEAAQSLLLSMMNRAQAPMSPHVTIAKRALVQQIVERRKGVPINMIESECRQAVDGLPDRRYAHIIRAKAWGNAVMLDLDWEGRGRLLKDVREICEHFEIPFDGDTKASYYPHITVLSTKTQEAAEEMAGELNEIIVGSGEPAPGEVRPTAIGFGTPTVLGARIGVHNGS
jgi:2'-5' RNA ligase